MRRSIRYRSSVQIRAVGVGGGGRKAIDRMILKGLKGVNIDFIAVDTDRQSLANSRSSTTIQIGKNLTQGLGTEGNARQGRRAAYEAGQEIKQSIQGSDMVFIIAAMGGGAGSGASSVIAEIAQDLGIFTIAIVTRPFYSEGSERARVAEEGIQLLATHVDTLIVIPNDRLLGFSRKNIKLTEAFGIAGDVIHQGVQVISDLINVPGLINLDVANIKAIMAKKGTTLMTVGSAAGRDRARIAAEKAKMSPLLGLAINGARGMLVNITAGPNLNLWETEVATKILRDTTHPGADFILGTVIDEKMGDEIRITVIATGFYNELWNQWSLPQTPKFAEQVASTPAQKSWPAVQPSEPVSRSRTDFSFAKYQMPAFQ